MFQARILRPCSTAVVQVWERHPSSLSSSRCYSRRFWGDRDVSITLWACSSNGANSFASRGKSTARRCRGDRDSRLFGPICRTESFSKNGRIFFHSKPMFIQRPEEYQGIKTIFSAARRKKTVWYQQQISPPYTQITMKQRETFVLKPLFFAEYRETFQPFVDEPPFPDPFVSFSIHRST